MKTAIGILLGLIIGATCRWFEIPSPAPPKLVGAVLVVAMTAGYVTTDKLMSARLNGRRPATQAVGDGSPGARPRPGS